MQKTYEHLTTSRPLRILLSATVALVATLLLWSEGALAKTNATKPVSSANPVTYGKTIQVTGSLKGNPSAGIGVELQASPFPYTSYTSINGATTSATGAYSFSVQPLINTRYRIITTTATPQLISDVLEQIVNQRVAFSVSDKTPKKGSLVRFYGTVTPARDGTNVSLQRRTSTGSWSTLKRVRLVDAGDSRSKYSKSMRVSKNATYRVTIAPTTSLGAGTSATRALKVH